MFKLADDTIDIYSDFVKIDIYKYIYDYTYFIDNYLQNFIDFYNGRTDVMDNVSQNTFIDLMQRCDDLNTTVKNTIHNFARCDFAYLVIMFDSIRTDLMFINKISKFLRSSKVNASSNANVTTPKVLTNYSSPEKIDRNSNDSQNDWTTTFVKNRVYQTDFDYQNGIVLQQESKQNQFFVENVIDNLNSENLTGFDLDANITFDTILNDFVTLNGDETYKQGVLILANMTQGDHFFYPNTGNNVINFFGNQIGLNLPFIVRDLNKNLLQDDTITDVSIDDIQINGGVVNLDFSTKDIQSKVLTQSANLSV